MAVIGKRRLGRTGIEISELAIGGGVVGGILPHGSDEARHRLLARTLESGINWIDTAAGYGDGGSEIAVGALLADIAAEQRPHVATKFRIDTENTGDIAGQVEASLASSLERLRMSSVTLLQLHNQLGGARTSPGGRTLSLDDLERPGGVLDAMEAMKSQGLTQHIGITALGVPESCRRVIAGGRVDTAQIYYNVLNPSAGQPVGQRVGNAWSTTNFAGLIEACKAHDVGVLGIRVFAAGVLATRERHGREIPLVPGAEVAAEEARAERVFEVLGSAHGSRAQAALRFALAEPRIASAIVGLSEVAQLDDAIAAAAIGPLGPTTLASLGALYERDFDA